MTYERESTLFQLKRVLAEQQRRDAEEAYGQMMSKRKSPFGLLKLVSSSVDVRTCAFYMHVRSFEKNVLQSLRLFALIDLIVIDVID